MPPMHSQPVTKLLSVTVFAAVIDGLPARAQGPREAVLHLGHGAASMVSQSVGHEVGEIAAGISRFRQLAAEYGTSVEEVAAVAESVDSYQGWIRPQASIDEMASAARAARDYRFVSAGVSIACDWMAGSPTNRARLQDSIDSAIQGMLMSQQLAFRASATDLAEKLAFIKASGTEQDQAAALWLCFAYEATS